MTKNQAHEWHERTEEGGKRYVRAHWNSREWVFHYLIEPHMPGWMPLEHPLDEDWLRLYDLMCRKYQRKKLPYKYVQMLEKILDKKGLRTVPESDEG